MVIHTYSQNFLRHRLDTSPAGSLGFTSHAGALAKVEGRRSLRQSKLTIAWRGTPDLDDWVAYIVTKTKSKKLILADQVSERKVKALLARVSGLSRRGVEKLAKG